MGALCRLPCCSTSFVAAQLELPVVCRLDSAAVWQRTLGFLSRHVTWSVSSQQHAGLSTMPIHCPYAPRCGCLAVTRSNDAWSLESLAQVRPSGVPAPVPDAAQVAAAAALPPGQHVLPEVRAEGHWHACDTDISCQPGNHRQELACTWLPTACASDPIWCGAFVNTPLLACCLSACRLEKGPRSWFPSRNDVGCH